MQLKTPKKTKKIVEPLETVDDQKQIPSGKEALPKELLQPGKQPLKLKKEPGVDLLARYKMKEEKARQKHIRRLRQFKSELIASQKDLEKQEEERKKKMEAEEEEKKRRREEKVMVGGEEALLQTGATQKRPTGLFGVGGKFKKLYKWFTPERKGRAPR